MVAVIILLLIVGGYFGYRHFIQEPKEQKGMEAMFRAEDYFRMDSVNLALNGDNVNAGFTKIISRYPGTQAASLASFYAGSCYLKLGDFNNAVKYLKDFKTPSLQVQAKAYGLLGDAYSELNKKDEAIAAYKKAGTAFEKDRSFHRNIFFAPVIFMKAWAGTKKLLKCTSLLKTGIRLPREDLILIVIWPDWELLNNFVWHLPVNQERLHQKSKKLLWLW